MKEVEEQNKRNGRRGNEVIKKMKKVEKKWKKKIEIKNRRDRWKREKGNDKRETTTCPFHGHS